MKAPFTEIVLPFTLEQPTEVSLCHSTTNSVTTEPLETLPVILMVVGVTDGGSSSTGADGTEREQSLISNSGGTIITRAHYHNKPSTPTHILTHGMKLAWVIGSMHTGLPKATSPADTGGLGRTVDDDDVPETDMV